ncbi:MAG: hypothetical protein GYB65_06930, partial [Chloroflexi bacterium]|nr:hypothetical protein [Chloroflexota bacterium]
MNNPPSHRQPPDAGPEVPPEDVTQYTGSAPPPIPPVQPAPRPPASAPPSAPPLSQTGQYQATRHMPAAPPATPGTRRQTGSHPPVPPQPQPGYSGSARQRGAARRAVSPRDSGWYLPWWSLVVLIGMVAVTAFVMLYVVAEVG